MANEEIIKKIAKASRSIVSEADAQKLTTEDEVESIVTELLSDEKSLEGIRKDALSIADGRLFDMYRGYRYYSYREAVKKNFNASLELLVEYGADYGPLSCLVLDGPEDSYPDVKSAVRAGVVDMWCGAIIDAAEDKTNKEK